MQRADPAATLERLLQVDAPAPEGIQNLPSWEDSEREEFIRLVRRHGVPGVARQRLATFQDPAAVALAATLEAGERRAIAHGLCLQRASRAAVDCLSRAGVEKIAPLKGVALHACLYGSVGARTATDVDLLIAPAERSPAHEALLRGGYRSIRKAADRAATLRASYEHSYLGPDGILIDLHTGLAQPERVDLDAAAMLGRACPDSRLAPWGDALLALDPVDTLLVLAVHQAQDAYQGPFRQIVDLGWWVHATRPDLEEAGRRAERAGAKTALWTGLWLARKRCGLSVSDASLERLAPGRLRRVWLQTLLGRAPLTPLPALKGSRLVQVATLYPVMDGVSRRFRFTLRYTGLRLRDFWEASTMGEPSEEPPSTSIGC